MFCASCNIEVDNDDFTCEECGSALCETCYKENDSLCKDCVNTLVNDDEEVSELGKSKNTTFDYDAAFNEDE